MAVSGFLLPEVNVPMPKLKRPLEPTLLDRLRRHAAVHHPVRALGPGHEDRARAQQAPVAHLAAVEHHRARGQPHVVPDRDRLGVVDETL